MPFMDLIKKAIFEEEPQAAPQPGKPAPSHVASRPLDPAPATYARWGRATTSSTRAWPSRRTFPRFPSLQDRSFCGATFVVIADKALRYKAALATAQSQAV